MIQCGDEGRQVALAAGAVRNPIRWPQDPAENRQPQGQPGIDGLADDHAGEGQDRPQGKVDAGGDDDEGDPDGQDADHRGLKDDRHEVVEAHEEG
jgi:hypothetical protein